jgi:metallopeptidase MepB
MSSNGTHTLPEPPPTFSGITPASIAAETELIISNSIALRDHLVRTLTPSTATFINLILPLIDSTNLAARRLTILKSLLVAVSRDAEIRDASREAAKKASAAEAASLMRADIAELVAAVYSRQGGDEDLDEQDRHLLSRMHGEYVRSGAGCADGTQRERLADAWRELNELRAAAQKTFIEGDDVDGVSFSRNELEGVSNDVLEVMKRAEEGDFWVAFRKEEHVREVWRYASSEETRRRIYVAEERRFPENVARLEKIVVLRDEIAKFLGFENHASLKMEDKMARSVEEVRECLSE